MIDDLMIFDTIVDPAAPQKIQIGGDRSRSDRDIISVSSERATAVLQVSSRLNVLILQVYLSCW
jgi:hypothetical protein